MKTTTTTKKKKQKKKQQQEMKLYIVRNKKNLARRIPVSVHLRIPICIHQSIFFVSDTSRGNLEEYRKLMLLLACPNKTYRTPFFPNDGTQCPNKCGKTRLSFHHNLCYCVNAVLSYIMKILLPEFGWTGGQGIRPMVLHSPTSQPTKQIFF